MPRLLKKKTTPIGHVTYKGRTGLTNKEKAEIIADFYADVCDLDADNVALTPTQERISNNISAFRLDKPDKNDDDKDYQRRMQTSPKEIWSIIKKLPSKKAPGVDEIHNAVIKNLPQKAILQLYYIINAISTTNHWPTAFKKVVAIPIPKNGKNLVDPGNFRPISILTGFSKIAGKVVHARLAVLEEEINFLPDFQFGFRAKHDTTLQVARITDGITDNFSKDKNTAMALLDIRKAFDRVWFEGLTFKLLKIGLPSRLVRLLDSYMTGRTLQVRIGTELSTERSVKAGVPQGSVLGPKLFAYYLYDMPTFSKTRLVLYADDTAPMHTLSVQR